MIQPQAKFDTGHQTGQPLSDTNPGLCKNLGGGAGAGAAGGAAGGVHWSYSIPFRGFYLCLPGFSYIHIKFYQPNLQLYYFKQFKGSEKLAV